MGDTIVAIVGVLKVKVPAAALTATPAMRATIVSRISPKNVSTEMPIKTLPKITSWSYSRYACWKECPAKAKYKFIDKMKEPSAPALERGNIIHKLAEDYTLGKIKKLPPELAKFKDQFAELKKSKPQVEQTWAFKADWSQTRWDDWNGCALRVKTDANCLDDDTLYVIDHKTGKLRDGYDDQLSLYAGTGMLVFPHVKEVNTQMWFLDSGDVVEKTYKVTEQKVIIADWEKRTKPMLADTRFAPKPGNHCRFCHFRKSNGGPCKF